MNAQNKESPDLRPPHVDLKNLFPFFVVAAAAVALFQMSLLSAIDAQSVRGAQTEAQSTLPKMVSPETPLRDLKPREFPIVLLERAAPLALLAGALLAVFFSFKAFVGQRLLPLEWQFDPSWTARDVLNIALFAIIILAPLQFLFPKDTQKPIAAGTWVAELIFRTLLAVAILSVVKFRGGQSGQGASAYAALGLRKDRLGRNVRIGVVAFLCFLAMNLAVGYLQSRFVLHFELRPIPQQPVELMRSAHGIVTQIALPFLAVVVAPFTEELFFRGFLQGMLRKRCGSNLAIIGTALLFATAHTNVFLFLPLFILGLMLGYLYDRTQSLAAPIALHFCQNASTLCVLVATKLAGG